MTSVPSASGRTIDCRISLSILLLAVLQASLAFNIDPAAWKYLSDPAAGFGYKVVQRREDNLLVSAPLQEYGGRKRGGIYQCTVRTSSCTLLSVQVPNEAVNMSLGMTMTKHPVRSTTLVCGPTIPRDCKTITTYNGMCLEINSMNQVGQPVPASLDGCPPVKADIAFLLDGSGSVNVNDFRTMKSFVKDLIAPLVGRGSRFAVAQYSHVTQIHFDFKTFNTGGWQKQVDDIIQLRRGTYTAAGIQMVVKNVFTTEGGSRPDVKKVLIVITDGESHDRYLLPTAARDADEKSIVRFAIGVGDAFNNDAAKEELNQIASDKRVFQVTNFEALGKIRDELQESIFSIEGSQAGGELLKMEMAQQGFSAAYLPEGGFQLGTVGAFQWNGGYQKYSSSREELTFHRPPDTEADGYLGYSMAVAQIGAHTFTIVGAPRFQHMGRVFVFSSDNLQQIIVDPSYQIGIYLGAEVCAMDVDGNTDTDVVLLSAPMYAEGDREGRVYVCHLTRTGVQCRPGDPGMTLLGQTGERGRFGTSLAPLPDLNADGLKDLAVGAPLENDGQGSIYIFNGERGKISQMYSIKEEYSQRIPGLAVRAGLKFFGLSISQSSLDLSGDALPDLAVGSKGAVLLLRSKPIVMVKPEVSFSPNKIPTNHSDCKKPLRNTATICFTMTSNTAAQAKINYTLTLDSTRPVHFIAYVQPKQQELTNTITLRGRVCTPHPFFIEACSGDALSPLSNRLSFTFEGLPSENNLSPSLAQNSMTPSYYPLGFEINCGSDNNCIDNLKVDFNFADSSELRVGIHDVLNVTVTVESREEDSYNSRVILTYPAKLSYRRVTMLQGRVECSPLDSEDGVTPGRADCTIDKPIFNGKKKAVFIISFHVDINSQFGQMVTFTANATSGNDHSPGSELFQTREIGVKYSIYVLISRVEDSTSYTNFSAGKNDLQKPVRQSMKVVNFDRDVNLTVIVKVPMRLGVKDIWVNPGGMQILGCRRGSDEEPTVKDFVEKLKKKQPLDCSVARCGVFLCNRVVSKEDNNFYMNISGNLSSGWIEQIGLTSALFDLVSTATLDYDRTKYIYFSTNSKNNPPVQKIETTVEVYAEVDLTKEIIGSTFGGLVLLALITAGLYKAGFFKSNVKQMMNKASDGAPQPDNEGVDAPEELA